MKAEEPKYPHTFALTPDDCANLEALTPVQTADLERAMAVLHQHNLHGGPNPEWLPEFREKVARFAQACMVRKCEANPPPPAAW
jgi:hypothetical protein